MTDSIQWYYYADAAPPAPPRAPCNDRTHAGAVFEGTPFSYHLKGDFSHQYSYMGIEKPRPPQGEQVDNKYTASDCLRECWYEAMRERLTGTLAYSFYENADLDGRPPVDASDYHCQCFIEASPDTPLKAVRSTSGWISYPGRQLQFGDGSLCSQTEVRPD